MDITEVKALDGYRLWLRFADGSSGEVDLAKQIRFQGVFEPLAERAKFLEVRVDPELGTVVWPNGADLDPDVLYSAATGAPLPFSA
jgi:hypothetical protein